jgi:hypothetical protein
MLPYSVDPAWYELTWYGQPTRPIRDRRPSLPVRLGLSAVVLIWSLVVLGRVV